MLFHDLQFWPFLAATLAAFYALPMLGKKLVLLVASCAFYMAWDWRFFFLLAFSTTLDWALGLAIARAEGARRRAWNVLNVVANLGVLGFFKYFNFFAASLATLLGEDPGSVALSIVLPVGISFYTFQGISYTLDVHRRVMPPVTSLLDFAVYHAFFPQLVAGPIVRAQDFMPQLWGWRAPSARMLQEGVQLVLLGLVKKVVFADHFAGAANAYFAAPAAHPGAAAAWSGTIWFALQIYCDFSGYTDIARGCAKLFGFEFGINFARPYLASDIREFWHRWHISLSTFLRDYLFIPLGGSRHGEWLTCRNLMITMLLGGLWHGASWNFVIWGGYHGLLLCAHRVWTRHSRVRLPRVLGALVTFVAVLVGWVFFRAVTLGDALTVLRAMVTPIGEMPAARGLTIAALVALAGALAEERWQLFLRLVSAPLPLKVGCYVLALFVLELFSVDGVSFAFVYFQF